MGKFVGTVICPLPCVILSKERSDALEGSRTAPLVIRPVPDRRRRILILTLFQGVAELEGADPEDRLTGFPFASTHLVSTWAVNRKPTFSV